MPDASLSAGIVFQPRLELNSDHSLPTMRAEGQFAGPGDCGREQAFTASLDGGAGSSRPKFVVERNDWGPCDGEAGPVGET
ncbi:MAG: hypothetical protein WA628_15700, partial [Terriglobales bacterium]